MKNKRKTQPHAFEVMAMPQSAAANMLPIRRNGIVSFASTPRPRTPSIGSVSSRMRCAGTSSVVNSSQQEVSCRMASSVSSTGIKRPPQYRR